VRVFDVKIVEPGCQIVGYRICPVIVVTSFATLQFDDDREALAKFVLQMLRSSNASELAIHHNS